MVWRQKELRFWPDSFAHSVYDWSAFYFYKSETLFQLDEHNIWDISACEYVWIVVVLGTQKHTQRSIIWDSFYCIYASIWWRCIDGDEDECDNQSRGWWRIKSTLCANCSATWFNCALKSYHDDDDDDDDDLRCRWRQYGERVMTTRIWK